MRHRYFHRSLTAQHVAVFALVAGLDSSVHFSGYCQSASFHKNMFSENDVVKVSAADQKKIDLTFNAP
jgi:hypothetical protein